MNQEKKKILIDIFGNHKSKNKFSFQIFFSVKKFIDKKF